MIDCMANSVNGKNFLDNRNDNKSQSALISLDLKISNIKNMDKIKENIRKWGHSDWIIGGDYHTCPICLVPISINESYNFCSACRVLFNQCRDCGYQDGGSDECCIAMRLIAYGENKILNITDVSTYRKFLKDEKIPDHIIYWCPCCNKVIFNCESESGKHVACEYQTNKIGEDFFETKELSEAFNKYLSELTIT